MTPHELRDRLAGYPRDVVHQAVARFVEPDVAPLVAHWLTSREHPDMPPPIAPEALDAIAAAFIRH